MLIENKFFFLSLPRCASTSFMASCIKFNLKIKHYNKELDLESQKIYNKIDINNFNINEFQYHFQHNHEPINYLKKKFGNQYEIISVNRNKYERFFSLWKHVLHQIDRYEDKYISNICKNFNNEELLFYKNYDLLNQNNINTIVELFIKKYNLNKISEHGKRMFRILIRPYYTYHLNDPNIIWFDYNKLGDLENWVSNKLNIDFTLEKINSSKDYECELKLNNDFKKNYDVIYEIYDEHKNEKTVI